MKLLFSRKTWYVMLLLAAALGMADGFALLAGQNFSFLETVSFGMTGLAALFLAAEPGKGDPRPPLRPSGKPRPVPNPFSGLYFAVFALALLSYLLFGGAWAMRLTLCWVLLAVAEYQQRRLTARHLWLLAAAEVLQAAAVACTVAGVSSAIWYSYLLWVLLCAARGWAALTLLRGQRSASA